MTAEERAVRLPARVPGWLLDAVVAVAVVGAAVAPIPVPGLRPEDDATRAVVLLPLLLLPLRRRAPVAVAGVGLGLFAIAAVLGTISPGAVLVVAAAVFGVATRRSRRALLLTTVGAVVWVVGCSLLAAIGGVFDPRVVQFAVFIAFAAAAGDAVRSRREHLAGLVERAERAEATREAEARRRVAEERLRIARDLHDVVAHRISVISLNAGVASAVLRDRPERAEEALATIRGAARGVLGEIGDLLAVLRTEDGDDAPTAPQPGLGEIDALVDGFRADGLHLTVRIEGDPATVTGGASAVAYRVLQEACTNALRYGTGRAHLLVTVETAAVRLVVTNPVVDSSVEPAGAGLGLVGLRERVAAVRGTVTAGRTPDGFRLDAVLPTPGLLR